MKCSTCRAKIPEGEQVAVWDVVGDKLLVRFVCLRCGDDPSYVDVTDALRNYAAKAGAGT
jgi:hypothetical protein